MEFDMRTVKYKDKATGRKIAKVGDLGFLADRTCRHNWFKIHFRHHKLKWMLRKADLIVAENKDVADGLVRYYFIPRDRITILH